MPEAAGRPQLHAADEPLDSGEPLGGEHAADESFGRLPERPAAPRAGRRRPERLGHRVQFGVVAATEGGPQARHRSAQDVPGGDRTRRHRRGGRAPFEGAQVHTGVEVSVLCGPAQRKLAGEERKRYFLAGK